MVKKSEWDIQKEKQEAIRKNGMKDLTIEQLQAIKGTQETIRDCLNMLAECQDLYLSDIRKLDEYFWKLTNEFNLRDN